MQKKHRIYTQINLAKARGIRGWGWGRGGVTGKPSPPALPWLPPAVLARPAGTGDDESSTRPIESEASKVKRHD